MRVSVVIPTYRRPDLLQRCLSALDAQDFAADEFEIVVADDAASAETEAQTRAFALQARSKVRYLRVTEKHGPAAARNAGWRAACGGIIAFTDDDCQPDARWLAEAIKVLEAQPDVSAVAGRTVVPLPAVPTDYELDTAGLASAEFVTANCFCRRDLLERIGGFDERYTAAWREDSDLHFAILAQGGTIAVAPQAIVTHPVRSASWGVSLRQQRKSLFDALLFKKYPALYRQRIKPGAPWNYYVIVAAMAVTFCAGFLGLTWLALVAVLAWLGLTGRFVARRLHRTSWAPGHVAEMAVTSALIPILSIFWRLYGACKFRVLFL
jgi:GT2 family glycosyltransferase